MASFVRSSAPAGGDGRSDRRGRTRRRRGRSEEHTSELQSLAYLVCRLLLEKKKTVHAGIIRDSSRDVVPHARALRGVGSNTLSNTPVRDLIKPGDEATIATYPRFRPEHRLS